eukprot:Gb_09305 [translate_table: standard]
MTCSRKLQCGGICRDNLMGSQLNSAANPP